jgi:hypothetical protein
MRCGRRPVAISKLRSPLRLARTFADGQTVRPGGMTSRLPIACWASGCCVGGLGLVMASLTISRPRGKPNGSIASWRPKCFKASCIVTSNRLDTACSRGCDLYNRHRPHEALGQAVPSIRYRDLFQRCCQRLNTARATSSAFPFRTGWSESARPSRSWFNNVSQNNFNSGTKLKMSCQTKTGKDFR